MWLSDRSAALQGHADRHQTRLAHLARDVAHARDGRDEALVLGLRLWLGSALALADAVTTLAASTLASKRRAPERRLHDLLARATPTPWAAVSGSTSRRDRQHRPPHGDRERDRRRPRRH